MKKALLISLMGLALLMGCRDKQAGRMQSMPPGYEDSAHNARNSLDYAGMYASEKMAQGNAIQRVTITGDGHFRLESANGKHQSGTYHWDESGNVIILDGPGKLEGTRIFVGENFLRVHGSDRSERIFRKTAP